MKESRLTPLFPIPLYITELDREFSRTELAFVNKTKKASHKSEGNKISNNNYVLNETVFQPLKAQLDYAVRDYFQKVLAATHKVQPYITQSWLNYTEKKQFHHIHCHPNSFISGVLYISGDLMDKIKFFKPHSYELIQPEKNQFNIYNSQTWTIPVKPGLVFLFPSSLVHCVDFKKSSTRRVSLAFNVFVKGTLGDNRALTELIL